MKAKIEVIIRDEQGNVIGQLNPEKIDLGHQSLHEIEGAVEQWRRRNLPDLEAQLLSAAQSEFGAQKKTFKSRSKSSTDADGANPKQ